MDFFFIDMNGAMEVLPSQYEVSFLPHGNDTLVRVIDADGRLRTEQVARTYGEPRLLEFSVQPTVRQTLVNFSDNGYEVLYVHNEADDDFGYAINLDIPEFSEWGYASLPR